MYQKNGKNKIKALKYQVQTLRNKMDNNTFKKVLDSVFMEHQISALLKKNERIGRTRLTVALV